jgi:hypothetical protein
MGFARSPAPHVVKSATVVYFETEREIASVFRAIDPFGIDNLCTLSPTGQHVPIGSCCDVVCCHCSRILG